MTDEFDGIDLFGDLDAKMQQSVFSLWQRGLLECYDLAKGRRRNELRGVSFRRYDIRGLEAFSESYGKVELCEALMPALQFAEGTPQAIRDEAERDAVDEFLLEHLGAAA